MTRQRSTWSDPVKNDTSRQAATSRQADPYTMNQEHPQPGPTDYESGDPDSWAETPTTNKNVEAEYEGDHVKRNEVGFGEFRDDTWKHKDADQWGGTGKYDNKTAAERKAAAAERLSRALLRTSNEKLIEDQAIVLMGMPNKHLAATLRRMDQISPDALPKEAKYKRALACCKVAARILPEETEEKFVESLATTLMTVDDPTLREMLRVTAAADKLAATRTADAESDAEEKSESETAAVKKDEDEDDKTAAAPKSEEDPKEGDEDTAGRKMRTDDGPPAGLGGGNEEIEGEKKDDDTACEAGGLCPGDSQMLGEMLQQEVGQPVPAGPAPELTELFEAPPAPAPVAPMPMGPMASKTPDITFDDGEEPRQASDDNSAAELDGLFADDPEVQAQREIQASEQEQVARESGFGSEVRTASTGAKKLGQVQGSKTPSKDAALENLWETP